MTKTSRPRTSPPPPPFSAASCASAVTEPANYRSAKHFDKWLKSRGIVGLSGIDTRALTNRIRENGMPNGVIAHNAKGKFDLRELKARAASWPGLVGMDLAKDVSLVQRMSWDEKGWDWKTGYAKRAEGQAPRRRHRLWAEAQHPALPDRVRAAT